MLRIDAYYFYRKGLEIHPLAELKEGMSFQESAVTLYSAMGALHSHVNQEPLQDKLSMDEANDLLNVLRGITSQDPKPQKLGWVEIAKIQEALTKFENVLSSELGRIDMYLVLKKNGFDTRDLVNAGDKMFPTGLRFKVPEAMLDVYAGMRCIAFALPTAAAFHLHRANESVLHRYWDAVTRGETRPTMGNGGRASMGVYLDALERKKAGDEKVRAALKSLKDLHRNPLMHPEQSLESVEEAIALHGAINSVVVHMLKVIPDESPANLTDIGLSLTDDGQIVAVPTL